MRPDLLWRALGAPGVGVVIAVAACTFAWGCGGDAVSAPAPSASAPASASAIEAPLASASAAVPRRFKSTPPSTALSNFQGQLSQTEELLDDRRGDLGLRSRVVGSYVSRGQVLGKPSDLVHALQVLEAAEKPKAIHEKDLLLLRASTFAAVHRFGGALKALESAVPSEELRQPTNAARQRGAIWAAQGRLDEGLALVQQVRAVHAEIGVLTLEAKILGDMGRVDDAAATFDRAEAGYRNPSPFALADLQFERGLMWETHGDLTKAKAAYLAATTLLPMHAHAMLHYVQLVTPKEGVDLLVALKRTCEDPEVDGRLGELRELLEKGSGAADLQAAKAGYEAILKQLPEAYADHAAWFFAGAGKDPDKAWKWAARNLEVRQTSGAYELAMTAARVAKRPAREHCELAKRARAYAWPSPRLEEELVSFARTTDGADCGLSGAPSP